MLKISISKIFFVAFLCLLIGCNNTFQNDTSLGALSAENALLKDAQEYASANQVSVEEALKRLRLQDEVGKLNAELDQSQTDTFGGLWIQHTPDFGIVINTTGSSQEVLDRIGNLEIKGLVEVKKVKYSLNQLRQAQDESVEIVRLHGQKADSQVDVSNNQVKLFVTSDTLYKQFENAGISLPSQTKVVKVDNFAKKTVGNFFGGMRIENNGCTAGFTVVAYGTTRKGILTAGHCRPDGYWGSGSDIVTLDTRGQIFSGPYDNQWMEPAGSEDKLKPWAKDNTCSDTTTCYRIITGTTNRPEQAINSWVCGYGITSGFRCGYITSVTFRPSFDDYPSNVTASYVRVHRDGADLSRPGDSGGPWYKGGSAWGINSGEVGSVGSTYPDAFYMAINYSDSLKVRVATGN